MVITIMAPGATKAGCKPEPVSRADRRGSTARSAGNAVERMPQSLFDPGRTAELAKDNFMFAKAFRAYQASGMRASEGRRSGDSAIYG